MKTVARFPRRPACRRRPGPARRAKRTHGRVGQVSAFLCHAVEITPCVFGYLRRNAFIRQRKVRLTWKWSVCRATPIIAISGVLT
eukprot:COSAG03_NODE_132_length_11910_cov_9.271103_3_plen_85_part_00